MTKRLPIEAWSERVSREAEALTSKSSLRLTLADGPAGLIEQGHPGLLPLWSLGKTTVGLLAEPQQPFETWRGVLLRRGNAVTLSAGTNTLLPRFLLTGVLADDESAAERLAKEWSPVSPLLHRLHDALGGQPSALEVIASVVSDSTARRALSYDSEYPQRFEAAMSEFARRIDSSAEFTHYADWVDAAIAGDPMPRHPPSAYGAWARLCYLGGRAQLKRTAQDISISDSFAGEVIEAFAGLDAAIPNIATWDVRPGSGSGEVTLSSLAGALDSERWRDPLLRGLVEALQEQGTAYDGLAHAEAVVALDEGGEPERAWGALHSAAWWMARNLGEAPPAILDGARLLCDRHGWDDLRWVVDRNAGGTA